MRNDEEAQGLILELVDAGQLAGAATLHWREGAELQMATAGWRDREARLPMERDTVFRIASMTKPITTLAALTLLEEGRFALEDPIARFAPELGASRVLRAARGPLDATDPARRPITFEDLLTHRSGITYGAAHAPSPLATAYAEALGGDIDSEVAPDAWIANLARLPLIDQPGATLHYGHSTDLLGLLIARIAGAPLGEVLARRVFEPLGMKDTGFIVPRERRGRRAALYGFDDAGRLIRRDRGPGGSTMVERPEHLAYVSGGQGLWSTLDDYLAFARVFVGGGAVDGVRLLRPETLALMTTNRLSAAQRATAEVVGLPLFAAGHGFGMGVAVVLEPERALPTMCGGNVGTVGWPGGFGGWWQADARARSVAIFLAHNLVEREQFERSIGFGVFRAITGYQALVWGRDRGR